MKKSELAVGLLYVAAGVGFLLAALLTESRLEGLLFGLTGAGIGPGVLMIGRYFYWNAPQNRARWQQRRAQEVIEQRDELKTQLRDRSGRYAYVLGLGVVCASMLTFSVLGALGLVEGSRAIVLYLGAYLLFQIAAGVAIFRYLLKKYE